MRYVLVEARMAMHEVGENFCETEFGSHGDGFGESGSRSFVLLKDGSVGVLRNEASW